MPNDPRLALANAYGHIQPQRSATIVGSLTGAGPGPLSDSLTETRDYAERINTWVKSLTKDAYAQIVYADPAAVAATATEWGTPEAMDEVAMLTARAKARGPAQTARDLDWSNRWLRFRAMEWEPWFYDLNSITPGVPPQTAWARNVDYERRVRVFYAEFATLGGGAKPSATPPETLTTPDGKPDPGTLNTAFSSIPWKPILAIGGGLVIAWTLSSVVKAGT